MATPTRKVFIRKTKKLGNSSGVLLPKSLLGADVRVTVIHPPMKIKKDVMNILEPVLEDILGVYLIKLEKNKAEVLAVSTKVNRHLEKARYKIDVVPLKVLKESLKEKKETAEKIKNAKVIINRKLLGELRG